MYDDLDQPEAAAVPNTVERAAWKQQLRQQFELWLESVEQMPETQELPEAPDLYSLYEELAAIRNESRKGNRKSAEIFSRFGESLDHFQDEIRRIGEQMTRIEIARADHTALPRSYFLGLVDSLTGCTAWEQLSSDHRVLAALPFSALTRLGEKLGQIRNRAFPSWSATSKNFFSKPASNV